MCTGPAQNGRVYGQGGNFHGKSEVQALERPNIPPSNSADKRQNLIRMESQKNQMKATPM